MSGETRKIASRKKTLQRCTSHGGFPSSFTQSRFRKHTLKDTEDRLRAVAIKKTDEAEGKGFSLCLAVFFYSFYLSRTSPDRWLGQEYNLKHTVWSTWCGEEDCSNKTTPNNHPRLRCPYHSSCRSQSCHRETSFTTFFTAANAKLTHNHRETYYSFDQAKTKRYRSFAPVCSSACWVTCIIVTSRRFGR